jgi:hypothetical protein
LEAFSMKTVSHLQQKSSKNCKNKPISLAW